MTATPLRREALDRREEHVDLARREGGGRLVHDEHARLTVEGLGHLDHLLLGDSQLRHGTAGIDTDAQLLQTASRLLTESLAIHDPEPERRLSSEGDVLRGGELGDEVELLVDDAYPQRLGVSGPLDLHRLPEELDLARVGANGSAQDLHERGLPRPVLPEEDVHLALPHLQRDAVEGHDTGEGLADALHAQGHGSRADVLADLHPVASRPPRPRHERRRGSHARADHIRSRAGDACAERIGSLVRYDRGVPDRRDQEEYHRW